MSTRDRKKMKKKTLKNQPNGSGSPPFPRRNANTPLLFALETISALTLKQIKHQPPLWFPYPIKINLFSLPFFY